MLHSVTYSYNPFSMASSCSSIIRLHTLNLSPFITPSYCKYKMWRKIVFNYHLNFHI